MSLQSRLNSLISAFGADVKLLNGRAALPSYAPSASLKGPYNGVYNVYNAKPTNLRRARAGMARAAGGGKMNILFIGDSVLIGYNGSITREADSVPTRAGETIANLLGVPLAGGGLEMAAVSTGSPGYSEHWGSVVGTIADTVYPGLIQLYAGASITYTSDAPGTTVEVYYSGLSTQFTVNIDGGTAQTITPTGAAAIEKTTFTGLANTPHTVKFNAATNYVFVAAVHVAAAYGVAIHNIAYGGTRAAYGNANQNWTDTASANSVYKINKGTWDTSGITADLVVCVLGGNDIYQGDTPANAIAGLSTIRGWFPNSDFIMAGAYEINGVNMTNWDDYWSRKYTLADTLDVPLVDWRHRNGDFSVVNAAGLIGADGLHESTGLMLEWGRNIGQIVAGAGPSDMPLTEKFEPLRRVINAQTGTTYTLVAADMLKRITMSNAAASTLTIPPDTSVNFPIGTFIPIEQLGAGQVTITNGAGVTLRSYPGPKIAGQNALAGVVKDAANTWTAIGALSA